MSEPITVRGVSDTARWLRIFVRSKRGGPTPCSTTLRRASGGRPWLRIANTLIKATSRSGHGWRAPIFSISSFPAPFRKGQTGCEPRCGLDARPYRMNLPPTLQWIEVDFQDIIAYKEETLANEKPRCRWSEFLWICRTVRRGASFSRSSTLGNQGCCCH